MRENLLKKQPTWGLRRAQGTGQKSATPATLTKVILVLLTMFLLPSAAWGQATITVAGITPDGNGNFTGLTGVTFDASTNTLTLDNARVTGTISSSIVDLKINLIGFSLFTLDNTTDYPVLINYTGDSGTTSPKVTFLADKLGASLIAIGSKIDDGHQIYITSGYGYDTVANPNDVWSIRETPYNGNKKIILVSKPYMIIHRLGDWDIDDSYLYNTNENIPKVDWLSFIPATDNTQFMLKLKQSEEDRDNGENTLISPITFQDGLSELVIDLDGNITINGEDIVPINSKNGGGTKSTTIKFTSSTEGSLTLIGTSTGLLENVTPIYDTGWSATITAPQGVTDITQATEAIIAKPYDLSVAGIPVSCANANNVLNDYGTVSFTPAEGTTPATLTLNNAIITVNGKNAIESGLENLTVNLVGGDNDNVITCQVNTDCVFKGTKSGAKVTFTRDATTPGLLTGSVSQESNMFVGIEPIFQNGLNYRREGDYFYIDTKVGLKIGDTEITSANIGSDGTITGISAISSGTVKFTPADDTTTPATPATLTLDNATLETYIKSTIKDLKVHLSGNNTITSSDNAFIYNGIESDPILTFSTVDPSDYENLGMLDIKGISSIGDIASGYAVKGLVGETSTAIANWKEDTSSTPDRSVSGWKYLVNTGSEPFVKLSYREVYDLWISYSRYCSDNLTLTGETFNPTTSTLTFNGISGSTYQIYSGLDDLTIKIGSKTQLKAITFGAPNDETIGATSGKLTIMKNETSTAAVNKLTLANDDTDGGVISGFSSVTIKEPMGVKTPSPFTTWGGTIHEAVISDEIFYDLWVMGQRVTSANASDIFGAAQSSQPIVATFDAEESTLTLNGLQIFNSTSSPSFIESGLENLTVILSGENKFMKGGDVITSYGFKGQGDKTRKITFTTSNNGSLYIETDKDNAVVGFTNVTYNDGLAPYMWNSKYYIAPVTLEKPAFIGNYDEEDSSKLLSVSIDSHATSTIGSNSETVTILAYDVVYTVDGGSETAYSESEPITISGPCTLTAKTIVGNTSSEVATGKYFGAKKDVFTMAIGESLADLDWCTPSFNAETEYLICNFISESSIFNYDVDDSSKPISTKASGTGTINIKLSYNDRMVTQILNNIDSPIATLTINVGEPLNSVFEGENTFGGLYSETNIQVPEGMKAYVITGIDEEKGTVITSPVDFIPAGVPVMLENEGEAKAITHVPYTGSATAPTNNKLNYSNPNTPAQSSSTDNWYVIYNNKFVKVTAGTQVKGGKCYLNLNGTSSSGTRGYYDIDGSDGTTGIREVKSEGVKGEKWNDGEWYTLQGRKFTTKPTKPGLYILNGKKVVIK